MARQSSCMHAIGLLVVAATLVAASAQGSEPLESGAGRAAAKVATPAVVNSQAMNEMLRADRDKDGMVSREELEHHDLDLARRFKKADADRDGRLTIAEFDKLLAPPDQSASRR